MSVTIEFPDELLVAAREDPESFGRDVMIHTLGRLYATGKVSAGLAMQILACDRLAFFAMLAERGYAAIDLSEAELDQESETIERLVSGTGTGAA